MRLNRSDAGQNGRATSICKAYAKRIVSLQAASNQDFIGHCENVRLPQLSQEWDFSTRFWDRSQRNACRAVALVNGANGMSDMAGKAAR